MTPSTFTDAYVSELTDRDPDDEGTSRYVWVFDDFVIKRAQSEFDRACNIVEERLWRHWRNSENRRLLARVIACADDGDWLVMERLEVDVTESECNALDNQLFQLGLSDIWYANLGRRNDGSVVVLDYGYIDNDLMDALGVWWDHTERVYKWN